MSAQHVPSTAIEVLDPLEQRAVSSIVQQATLATGLSPWERHKIEWRIRRQRGELILQLAEIEAQTIVAEAIVTSQGRVSAAREQAALRQFAEQLRCLLEAGRLRDTTLIDCMKLSEDSREVMAAAVDRVTGDYIEAMERRAKQA